MPDLDDVLERLVNDASFRQELADDPATALAGYHLSVEDLDVLASTVADGPAGPGAMEGRQSKSAMFSLFAQVLDVAGQVGGARAPGAPFDGVPDPDQGVAFTPAPPNPNASTAGPVPSAVAPADVLFDSPSDVPFNPAPPPPGGGGVSGLVGADEVMFNPQPDPPAEGLSSELPAVQPDDQVGDVNAPRGLDQRGGGAG